MDRKWDRSLADITESWFFGSLFVESLNPFNKWVLVIKKHQISPNIDDIPNKYLCLSFSRLYQRIPFVSFALITFVNYSNYVLQRISNHPLLCIQKSKKKWEYLCDFDGCDNTFYGNY